MPNDWTQVVSIVGAIAYTLSFIYYNWCILRQGLRPSQTTWAVWAVLGILNALSYSTMAGDPVKAYMAIASGVLNFSTFIAMLSLGRRAPFTPMDVLCGLLGLVAAITWASDKQAPYANQFVMLAIIISTIPTLRSVWNKPDNEAPLPWVLLSLCWLPMLVVVIARWEKAWDVIMPIVAIVVNGSVAVVWCLRRCLINNTGQPPETRKR